MSRQQIIKTNDKGEISGSNPKLASGYESSALYKDAAGNVVWPLGVYVITEVKASEGYLIDTERIVVTVSEDGTDNVYTTAYNTGNSSEVIMRGGVRIQKVDSQLNDAVPQGDATLEGAEFTIYNRSKHSVMVNGEVSRDIAIDTYRQRIRVCRSGTVRGEPQGRELQNEYLLLRTQTVSAERKP